MVIKSGADMLIATRVALDKVESFRNESFEPEEIELNLNKSQFRLLDDLINKNFQQGTLRYEWIRPFLKSSNPVSPAWSVDDNIPVEATYPSEMYYLISATGISTKSGIDATTKFDDDCDQPITDPASIDNPITKLVNLDVIETGQAVDRTVNSFYGNNPRSPRTEVTATGLKLYRDERFIITNVVFDYTIEPIEIDVASTSDTQWSVSANEKIIDYTVEYMRLTIADPMYQGNVNDFNIRTQNA